MSEPLQYYVATPVRRAQSRVGIASFSLGVLSAILLALALVLRRDGFSDHDIMVALVPLHIPFLG